MDRCTGRLYSSTCLYGGLHQLLHQAYTERFHHLNQCENDYLVFLGDCVRTVSRDAISIGA